MGGIEMLMKSFGLDPASIQKKISEAGEDFKAVVTHFNERLNKIETEILLAKENQHKIMACLKIEPVIVRQDVQSIETYTGDKPNTDGETHD